MSFSAELGKTIEDYKEHSREYIDEYLDNRIICTICGCLMGYHGHYDRGIKDKSESVCIHRIACRDGECRHTEAVLPDFLLPGKQFGANEAESVLIDADNTVAEKIETEASIATVRRWIRQMRKEILGWIAKLTESDVSVASEDNSTEKAVIGGEYGVMERLALLIKSLPSLRFVKNILSGTLVYFSNLRSRNLYT